MAAGLTYSHTASAGDISGDGGTATLNTRGAQPGHITVTCNAIDDRNPPLTSSFTTIVNVEPPQLFWVDSRIYVRFWKTAYRKLSAKLPDAYLL